MTQVTDRDGCSAWRGSSHRAVRALCVSLLPLIMIAGCAVASQPGHHGRLAAQMRWQQPASLPQSEALAAWTYVSATSAGFANPDFSTPGSLYATAWSLQALRAASRSGGLRTSTRYITTWIGDLLAHPHERAAGASRLETLHLCELTLQAVGQAVPRRLIAEVSDMRHGGMYSADANAPPTWADTATAVQVLAAAKISVPTPVATAAQMALGRTRPPSSLGGALNDYLPLWQAADLALPPGARARGRAQLAGLLRALSTASVVLPVGVRLGVFASIREVAAANKIEISLPRLAGEALLTPDGLPALVAGSATPDPQVAYDMLRLGYHLSSRAIGYLAAIGLPDGWIGFGGQPEPVSSYFGTLILGTKALAPHAAALAQFARAWLSRFTSQSAGRQLQGLPDLWYDLRLLSLLGSRVGRAKQSLLIRLLSSRPSTSDPTSADETLRDLAALGARPRPSWLARERATVKRPATMDGVLLEADIGELTGDRHLAAAARRAVRRFAFAGAYRYDSTVGHPDIYATAIALHVLGMPAGAGAMAARFMTRAGTALLPAAAGRTPLDLTTIGLGLDLSKGIDPLPLVVIDMMGG